MIGRTLGRYRVTAPLGRGGMATVWLARDTMLERDVALKVLDERLAASESARRRFRHEAEIAQLLDHPAIAPVLGQGEDGDVAWIAMQRIVGRTLAERLAGGVMPLAEIVHVGMQVAAAVGYAHARGVVHRDLSPRNVMLADDGRVYVLDFGLAHAEGQTRITSTGVLMGTRAYIAPEVLSGATADPRADVYALGVLLYEMIAGAAPFASEPVGAQAYAAVHRDPEPPGTRRAGLPPALAALVMHCLARDPAARTASMDDLQRDLAAVRDHLGASGEPAPGAGAAVAARLVRGGDAPVHLALLPLHVAGDEARATAIAEPLACALAARLPSAGRVHTLAGGAPRAGETLGAYAARTGANLLLEATVRVQGTRARVELALVDPTSEARIDGRSVDGSALEPFALEDACVDAARAALRLPEDATTVSVRRAAADPAASERYRQALRDLERFDHEASVAGAVEILERLCGYADAPAAWHATLCRAYIARYRQTQQRHWEHRAAEAAARALELAPDAPETLVAIADLRALGGQDEAAIEGYQRALAADAAQVDAWLGLAAVHDRSERRAEAEDACRHAIALRPADWRGYRALGLVYFRAGEYARALEPWRKVTQLSPENSRGARDVGSALYQLGRLDDAIAAFRRANELQPHAAAYGNLGAALFALERWDEAAAAFRTAASLRPADALAWGNLGNALRLASGHEAEAAAALDRAIELMREKLDRDAGHPVQWAQLADWCSVRGRRAEAEAAIARALEQAPDDAQCLELAAYVAAQHGDRAALLAHLGALARTGALPARLRSAPTFERYHGDPEFEACFEAPEGPPGPRSRPARTT